MNDLLKLARRNPLLVIATAAVIGLAAGTGVLPIPLLARPAPPAPPPAAPAAPPPPPPDPLDAY